jgi:peptidoglycan/LPS O-acetylase OafA/YrhL
VRLDQLTVTRFLAALGIVVYHMARSATPFSFPAVLDGVVLLHLLVSFFFTLSGFILVVAQVKNKTSEGELPASLARIPFYKARFARIYPLYFVALLAWALFAYLRPEAGKLEAGPFISNIFLFQAWVPGWAITCNYPGWSLSVETFFYLLFPFAYTLLQPMAQKALWLAGFGILALCMAATGLALAGHAPHDTIYYLPLMHTGTFIMGVCGGFFFLRNRDQMVAQLSRIRLGAFLLSIAAAYLLLNYEVLVPFAHNGLLAPVWLALIYGIALTKKAHPMLATPPLPFLGEISYGLYILHIPVGLWGWGILTKTIPGLGDQLFYPYLIMLIFVSTIAYYVVERPARTWLRKLL